MSPVRESVCLAPFCTLRAGGNADRFVRVHTMPDLIEAVNEGLAFDQPMRVMGRGSNMLPADEGVPGLVILNSVQTMKFGESGEVECSTGVDFQDLFLATAQRGLGGLEFAVGIPGSVGGALVSNAGAYRSNVSEFLTELEVLDVSGQRWVSPDWMGFSYRDSKLRQDLSLKAVVLKVRMKLPRREKAAIYNEARNYQRQRIGKQPPPASAGSFFKNVVNFELAQSIEGLTEGMRTAGVIPSGFLIEAVGMKGYRHERCMFSKKHANFMLNTGGATSTAIYELAQKAKSAVFDKFGVTLEEEVLYVGRWPHLSS